MDDQERIEPKEKEDAANLTKKYIVNTFSRVLILQNTITRPMVLTENDLYTIIRNKTDT